MRVAAGVMGFNDQTLWYAFENDFIKSSGAHSYPCTTTGYGENRGTRERPEPTFEWQCGGPVEISYALFSAASARGWSPLVNHRTG